MGVNTLHRDWDIARIIADYDRRIAYLERQMLVQPAAATIWQNVDGGFDTGWQNIVSFTAPFVAQAGVQTPMMRRFGPIVMIKGRATATVAVAGSTNVFAVPAGFSFEVDNVREMGRSLEAGAAGFDHRYYMDVGGNAAAQGLTLGAGATATLTGMYAVVDPF